MQWSESVLVRRPRSQVHRAVADENAVLEWSAWPQATGYSCTVDGDGTTIGSQIVFRDASGVEQGRQRLVAVGRHRVEYGLRNRGPGGREMTPAVTFHMDDVPGGTRVTLEFEAEVPLPMGARQLVEALMSRRIRALHVRDLAQLKEHVERQPAAA